MTIYTVVLADGQRLHVSPEEGDIEFEPDDRIVAGTTAEEREEVRIIEIDGDRALIAWDQGTRTWIDLADCELA